MDRSYDLVCFSHLRWDFVYQRPQHLLGRCAQERRVFFFEEPTFGDAPPDAHTPWKPLDGADARLDLTPRPEGAVVAVPRLRTDATPEEAEALQQRLVDDFLAAEVDDYVLWYYTPMALGFTRHLEPLAVVYDCMDELSAFAGAPQELREREAELFERADLVFTGGQSLYEAKRERSPNTYLFPSSVDVAHFAQARSPLEEPEDQAPIGRPRLGFFGVIDERMDYELVLDVAAARPEWQIVLVGPRVDKYDTSRLRAEANVHLLGPKPYAHLPAYLAGWDVALLPFARNESTRFISPTKTPEYLAAGRPVVSTSIRDVVRPYGERGLVRIADTPEDFVAAVELALGDDREALRARADAFLGDMSWDRTWRRMAGLIEEVVGSTASSTARLAF